MWAVFAKSFQTQLTAVLGYDAATAKQITKSAKPKYKEIIAKLPEFEKADRFQLNIIGCAMLGAFVLCMPKRPDTEALTVYYENAQMTPLMKWFCRKSGKSKFTAKDIAAMKATAALKAADRNPYSWNMDFYEYPDTSPAFPDRSEYHPFLHTSYRIHNRQGNLSDRSDILSESLSGEEAIGTI